MKNYRPRAAIYTLGCRVNQYESEAISGRLASLGFDICDFSDVCDVYIINTCAVTAESERKSRQMIRRAHSQNPAAKIIVAGCYSQLSPTDAMKLDGVSYVCGNRNKLTAADAAARLVAGDDVYSPCVLDLEAAPLEGMNIARSDRTRAYVKIEDGCDNRCAFCIIKKARGAVVSRKADEIISEVNTLTKAGYREIVLTGIEVASYGKDTGEKLSDLILGVAKNDGVERIRLASLEPSVLTCEFVDALAAEPKFMPSFHLSLQSGSSRVLALMRRKYNAERVLQNVKYIKSKIPTATFTADIIVGFPNESENDFIQTCKIAEEIGFLHMHIFPFSPRPGTEAAEMDGQIPDELKRDRAARLKKLGDEISEGICRASLDGRTRRVLFETPEGSYQVGHTPEMLEVRVKSGEALQGKICSVVLTEYKAGKLYGKIAEDV